MTEHDALRQRIHVRYCPLLDMALSLLVLQNPESFGGATPWAPRVQAMLPGGLLERLRAKAEEIDLFDLLYRLEEAGATPGPDALANIEDQVLTRDLRAYWQAIAPEVAARAGLITQSIQAESARLAVTDPLAFMTSFSDRVSVTGDGHALLLEWGKGMRTPLAELHRILYIPSVFSPRLLMFYRLDEVQLFFYAPQAEAKEPPVAEAPESLTLGFAALADTTRLKLLRLISTESLPAQEMAARLALNESTVSRHLRLLVEAGLVGRERNEGKYIFYGFHADRIDRLATGLRTYLGRNR